ncbi:MAG: ATP-dependent zinc metalloprotease FtsH, partial [Nevskiales bacterium]
AKKILQDHMDKLHLMTDALMKYETIDARQIAEIMQGREPGPPDSWEDSDSTPPGNASATGKPKTGAGPGTVPKPAGQH